MPKIVHKTWNSSWGRISLVTLLITGITVGAVFAIITLFDYSLTDNGTMTAIPDKDAAQAQAAAGELILLWDGTEGSIPTGWDCVSCQASDPFYQVFPRASSSYSTATAGGPTSVTHTITIDDHTQGAMTDAGCCAVGGGGAATGEHNHATGTTYTSGGGDTTPAYLDLLFIQAATTTVPQGAIAMFYTASLPGDWTRYGDLDNKYLRGNSATSTGGNSSHNHSVATTSLTNSGSALGDTKGPTNTFAAAHKHSLAGNTNSASNTPPYVDLVFAKADISQSIPVDMLAMFDNASLPTDWTIVSNASPYQDNLLRGNSSFGATGGFATHTHPTLTVVSGNNVNTADIKGNGGDNFANHPHNHDFTLSLSTETSLPVYRYVIIGKYTPPASLDQIHYRWRNDDGPEGSGGDGWSTSTVEALADSGDNHDVVSPAQGVVYLSYIDPSTAALYFASSSDHGDTWSTTTVDTAGTLSFTSAITSPTEGTAYILYSNGSAMLSARTTDSGVTWSTSTVNGSVSAEEFGIISPSAGTVYASYIDTGSDDLYFASSGDGAATWNTAVIDSAGGGNGYRTGARISSPEVGTAYIGYANANTNEVLFASTSDSGSTWGVAKVVDTVTSASQQVDVFSPSAGTIYMVYADETNNDLYFASSGDNGSTWSTTVVDNRNDGIGSGPSVYATDGGSTVYIAYTNWLATDEYLILASSTDSGVTWGTSTVDGPWDAFNAYPDIYAYDTDIVYIANGDNSVGDETILFAKNTNGAGATWAANEDTPITGISKQTTYRLRLEVSNEGDQADTAKQFRLEYSSSTGSGWTQVQTTGTEWVMVDSTHFTDGASTTDHDGITNMEPTFTAGQIKDTGSQTGNITLEGDEFTELEFSIAATSTAVGGQTYWFRVTDAGTPIDTYTKHASATLAAGAGAPDLQQLYYRWRADDGSESTASWRAATNTPITGVEKATTTRLRVSVSNEGTADSSAEQFRIEYATGTSGPWSSVGDPTSATAHWVWQTTGNISNGASTTAQLTVANDTFRDGQIIDANNQTAAITLSATEYTELEYSMVASSTATDGQTYWFRVSGAGDATDFSYPKYASATLATPAGPTEVTQGGFRWYENEANLTPSTAYASEYATATAVVKDQVLRLRMNVAASGTLTAGQTFKLQFSTSTGSGWTDMGAAASGALWRGKDVAGLTDGNTVPSTLLTSSTVAQTYEEQNDSASTPNEIADGGYGEFDWVVEDWDSEPNTTYYFRMIYADDTVLDGYDYYPALVTADQATWRAAEDTATSTTVGSIIRLRVELANLGSAATSGAYKLEYAAKPGDGCSAVSSWTAIPVNVGASEHFEMEATTYYRDNETSTNRLANSEGYTYVNGFGVEDPSTTAETVTLNTNEYTEIEFAFKATSNATDGQTYCFRAVNGPLDGYDSYPELTVGTPPEGTDANLTLSHYRWRLDDGSETGASWDEPEDTSITGLTKTTIRRLRFQVWNNGSSTVSSTYRIEYSTSTSEGWTTFGSANHWEMANSDYLDDGTSTTNVANGLNDAGSLFVSGEARDSLATTGEITLQEDEFTELEYSIRATTNAFAGDTYWFRLYDVKNATSMQTYTVYASATLASVTYAASGSLESHIIDTTQTSGVTPNSLRWEGTQPAGTTVKFQIASSDSTGGPWNYQAWNASTDSCDSDSYYNPGAPQTNIEIKALCHVNERYIRYKVILETTDISTSPQVDRVILNYAQ